MVLNNIHSALLTLETIRPWEKNPDGYSSGITNSAFTIMERKFASPDDRLRSLIAREKLMPSRLDQARENLKNPPRIFTEIAIDSCPAPSASFSTTSPRLRRRQRPRAQSRIREDQRCRHRRAQQLSQLAQD